MYNIPLPDESVLKKHFSLYSAGIRKTADAILNDNFTFESGRANGLKLNIKFLGDQSTDAGRFLKSLMNDADLELLLTGSLNNIIKHFGYLFIDLNHRRGISKTKYPTNQNSDEVEDLNEIAHYIFVDEGYEKILDKDDIIIEKDLKICPYCGSTRIHIRTKEDGTLIKPTLDHYLPKRKFPWLAMNYHNLVPTCGTCNDSPNKHISSPFSDDLKHTYLPHPYTFNDDDFAFISFKKLPEMLRDQADMDIRIDYKNNSDLRKGYNNIIAIESLYRGLNQEAHDIWQSIVRNSENYREFVGNLVNTKRFNRLLGPQNILKFDFNDDNSRIYPEYKFKKDLYEQFMSDIFVKRVF